MQKYCRSHDDCEKDHKSTDQIVKEKKSEEKNRAKAVKSLKKKTKTKSLRMVESVQPQPSTSGTKMANKLAISKDEKVKKP